MNIGRAWLQEALLFAGIFSWLGLAGLFSGYLLFALVIALILYLLWHLLQLYRFTLWLDDAEHCPLPYYVGAWRAVLDESVKLRKLGHKRKRQLRNSFQESTGALPDAAIVLDERGAMEWWNPAASTMFDLDDTKDSGRILLKKIKNKKLGKYLRAEKYERPLKLIAPLDRVEALEIRVVPYGSGKRLFQARDISRLQQLETVRQDFVANVSHEMRTPLTVILGYLETMAVNKELKGLTQWSGVVGEMLLQTARLTRIVEDLLLLSRLDSGRGREGEEQIEVADMLTLICDEARRLSGDMKHKITLKASQNLGLRAHPNEVYSLFSNLVFNAVRYTPAGGKIQVRWKNGALGPCFSVTDTGIGIAKKHIPRLTERFYRVDVGRSRKSGGTGLGLAIVKHVVNRHGGRLKIESESGVGSTFRCCFSNDRVVMISDMEEVQSEVP